MEGVRGVCDIPKIFKSSVNLLNSDRKSVV